MTLASCGRRGGIAGAIALAGLLSGCSGDSGKAPVTRPVPQPGFAADSPIHAVQLFEWSWEHQDLARFTSLLADDFQFVCSVSDSAGNAFQGHGLTRIDELESAHHLFTAGGVAPPAKSISLQFDRNLIPQQDTRAGKQDQSHYQEIVTTVVLRIETPEESFQVTGEARFHLARGDVAVLPAELTALGVQPDPGLWYIERWDDETFGGEGAAAGNARRTSTSWTTPAKNTTWCSIMALYR
jgi:hypothetical protein